MNHRIAFLLQLFRELLHEEFLTSNNHALHVAIANAIKHTAGTDIGLPVLPKGDLRFENNNFIVPAQINSWQCVNNISLGYWFFDAL